MATPYLKRGTWYLRWKDEAGRWRGKACGARTKAEARALQGQLERRAERVRLGVETGLPEDGGGTLAELLRWWLDMGLIRFGRQLDYAACLSRAALSNSAGLT